MRGRTKGERRRIKVQLQERREKEAKKRRINRRRTRDAWGQKVPRPGDWLKPGTADIHRAIIQHLRYVTKSLKKDLADCRVVSPFQTYYSDLAFRNNSVFLEYKQVMIVGDRVLVAMQLIPRSTGLPRLISPLWSKEYTFILADPALFDNLSGAAAELVNAYYQLVEYPNHGA